MIGVAPPELVSGAVAVTLVTVPHAAPPSTVLPLPSNFTQSFVVVVPVDAWTIAPLPWYVALMIGVAPPELVSGAVALTLVTVPVPQPAPESTVLPLRSNLTQSFVVVVPVDAWTFAPFP